MTYAFAPKDEKALVRKGALVTLDWLSLDAFPFRVIRKEWDAVGSLHYTVQRSVPAGDPVTYRVRQKELSAFKSR